jgi:hypothetical protein
LARVEPVAPPTTANGTLDPKLMPTNVRNRTSKSDFNDDLEGKVGGGGSKSIGETSARRSPLYARPSVDSKCVYSPYPHPTRTVRTSCAWIAAAVPDDRQLSESRQNENCCQCRVKTAHSWVNYVRRLQPLVVGRLH